VEEAETIRSVGPDFPDEEIIVGDEDPGHGSR
jgi:hypothetical protein